MRKYILFLGLMAAIVGCKNDSKKETEVEDIPLTKSELVINEIKKDSSILGDCGDFPCPKMEIELIDLEGDADLVREVNQKNEEELIQLLHLNEDKPKAESVEDALQDFGKEYLSMKEEFPESAAGYELILKQKVENNSEKTFVLKTDFYIFTGGAHGYGGVQFLNFDPKTGKYLTHKDLISDLPAFTKYVEKAFRQLYEIPEDVDINSKGFFFEDNTFALPENIAVTDDSVILIYNPYEAASYSEGTLRFLFPRKEVGKWLNY